MRVFILLITLLGACTKFGKNVTVKGRVLNPVTGEGIEGAEIWLQRSAGGIPGGNKTVKTANSDSEGYFEVSKAGLRNYTAICVLDESYYKMGWQTDGTGKQLGDVQVENINVGKKKSVDFFAVPYGKIVHNIQNINCEGEGDLMQFRRKWQFGDFEYYSTERIGCYSVVTEAIPIPSGTYIYETKVTRSGNTTFVYDTVTVSSEGVSTVNLLY